jgi:hypothetical protein
MSRAKAEVRGDESGMTEWAPRPAKRARAFPVLKRRPVVKLTGHMPLRPNLRKRSRLRGTWTAGFRTSPASERHVPIKRADKSLICPGVCPERLQGRVEGHTDLTHDPSSKGCARAAGGTIQSMGAPSPERAEKTGYRPPGERRPSRCRGRIRAGFRRLI